MKENLRQRRQPHCKVASKFSEERFITGRIVIIMTSTQQCEFVVIPNGLQEKQPHATTKEIQCPNADAFQNEEGRVDAAFGGLAERLRRFQPNRNATVELLRRERYKLFDTGGR